MTLEQKAEGIVYDPIHINAALRNLRKMRLPTALEGKGMNGEEFAVLTPYATDMGRGDGYITIPRLAEVLGFSGQSGVVRGLEMLEQAKLLRKILENVEGVGNVLDYRIDHLTRVDLRKRLDRLTEPTKNYIDTKVNAQDLKERIAYAKRVNGYQTPVGK